jgi:hypothetical protein
MAVLIGPLPLGGSAVDLATIVLLVVAVNVTVFAMGCCLALARTVRAAARARRGRPQHLHERPLARDRIR